MSSRAVSAVLAAGSAVGVGHQPHYDGEDEDGGGHHQHRRQHARIDYDESSDSDGMAHSIRLPSPSRSAYFDDDNRVQPVASTSKASTPSRKSPLRVPESAPAASTSFLRERSTYDSSPSEEAPSDRHAAGFAADASSPGIRNDRFSSPALTRRRYPSTVTTATTTTNNAFTTAAPTSTRRPSSKSRRSSSAAVFDVKGKGVARRDHAGGYSDDEENDDNEDGVFGNGYAVVKDDHDSFPQAPRTAPLSHALGTRRSVSHSHPSTRYTTGFDPFMHPTSTTLADYPETRVKKKRSYTYTGPGNGSGRSREVSGSSSPDLTRGSFTPSSQQDSLRRKAHLPRSASEFIAASNPAISSMRHDRPSNTKRASSGSSSPLYPRSHSSGNILSADIPNRSGNQSIPNENNNNNNTPPSHVLRTKLSGLQMRNGRSSSRSSPVRATFSNIPQRENITSSAVGHSNPVRKRAKSSLYPLDGSLRPSSSELSGTAVPTRSFSSQHVKRHNTLSGGLDDVRAHEGHPAGFPRGGDGPTHGRRVHLAEDQAIPPSPPAMQNGPSPSGLAGKSILKSGSQAASIAAMVSEQGSNTPFTSQSDTGPSLQDLLSQVDLKSALTLVREANNQSNPLERKPPIAELSFQASNNVRASIEAPSAIYRSGRSESPVKSIDQSILSSTASAASPTTNGSRATRTPLLSSGEGKNFDTDPNSVGGPVQPSASIRFIPENSITPDKKRKRLSMKRLLGGHHRQESNSTGSTTSDHQRHASHTSQQISEDRFSTVGSLSAVEPDQDHEDFQSKVDPTMRKYAAAVKSELEIRYLPVYTALAMDQAPPNPLAVARHLQMEEEARRSQSLHSLSPRSPSRRYLEEAHSPARQGNPGQLLPLADRIRRKGHKRSVWEVYPRDIAAYVMDVKFRSDRYDLYPASHRSDAFDSSSRGRSGGHKHASSEISLGSLASIREGKPLDAFIGDSRHRHGYNNSTSLKGSGNGSARYMMPLSPARSRSGQSDISSYMASDDAIAAGVERSTSDTGPGWTSEGQIQSSPEHSKWHSNLSKPVKHQSSLSWSTRGFRILRPDSNASSSLAQSSGLPSHDRITDSIDGKRSYGGEIESEGALSDGHSGQERRATHPALHRSTASDAELRSKSTSLNGSTSIGNGARPTMSRSTSKASSLTGLSRILGGKRPLRPREDGYRSTDNEDHPRVTLADSRSHLYKSTLQPLSQSTSRQSLNGRETDVTETDHETDASVFGAHHLRLEEVDVPDEQMERAEG